MSSEIETEYRVEDYIRCIGNWYECDCVYSTHEQAFAAVDALALKYPGKPFRVVKIERQVLTERIPSQGTEN